MLMKAYTCSLLVGLLGLLTACTSTETDASKATTGDFLFGQKRLNEHLEARRQYLQSLQTKLDEMDDELLASKASLFAAKRSLEQAEKPGRELTELLADVSRLEQESESLTDQLLKARDDLDQLDRQIADQKLSNEQMKARTEEAKARVDQLEKQLAVVTSGITRAVKLRAEQVLREEG